MPSLPLIYGNQVFSLLLLVVYTPAEIVEMSRHK